MTEHSAEVMAGARAMYEAGTPKYRMEDDRTGRAVTCCYSLGWNDLSQEKQDKHIQAFAAGLAAMWQRDMTLAPFDTKLMLATRGDWVGEAFRYDKEIINGQDEWVWADTGRVVKHKMIAWRLSPKPPADIGAPS